MANDDRRALGPDPRQPRWIRIGVWMLLVACVAMALALVLPGFL